MLCRILIWIGLSLNVQQDWADTSPDGKFRVLLKANEIGDLRVRYVGRLVDVQVRDTTLLFEVCAFGPYAELDLPWVKRVTAVRMVEVSYEDFSHEQRVVHARY